MATKVGNYLSLIKFSHTIFAMPFAMIGFFMGATSTSGELSWKLFFLVITCMIFARSAAMAFNRYLDRDIDILNPRTKIREIPSGVIKPQSALIFTVINCLLFVTATYFINPLCFYLSPVALFVVLFYSYTKRFTALCHLVLGTGLSLAPVGAYLAVTNRFDIVPIMLGFAVLCWVSGFDIIYALQDEEFDKKNKLSSIPSILGKPKALLVSRLLHLVTASLIVIIGLYAGFSFIYWIGCGIFLSMLVYQHTLVSPTNLSKVNLAFFTANGIASVTFACFVITDMFL